MQSQTKWNRERERAELGEICEMTWMGFPASQCVKSTLSRWKCRQVHISLIYVYNVMATDNMLHIVVELLFVFQLDKALSDCCTNWVLDSRQREREENWQKKKRRRENSSSTQTLMRFFQDKKKVFHDRAGRIFLWVRNVDKLNLHCGSSSPFCWGKSEGRAEKDELRWRWAKKESKRWMQISRRKESFQLLLCDVDSMSSLSLSYTLRFS